MKLSLLVRVASTTEAREAFAKALTEHDAFEGRVNTAAVDAVRACLRRVGALHFDASHYVNGAPSPNPDAPPAEAAADDLVASRLQGEVDAELRTKFGLEVVRIDLEPGDADPLIDRMKALTRLPIQLPAEMKINFERGDEATRVWRPTARSSSSRSTRRTEAASTITRRASAARRRMSPRSSIR